MNVLAGFTSRVSVLAIESGLNHALPRPVPLEASGRYEGMQALDTVTLLGDHAGVADDFILNLLEEAAAA